MVTKAPSSLNRIYVGLENKFGSAVKRGGIVGDLAHRERGGLHISRQDQPSGNYSVQGFNRNGPSDVASAIDITTNGTLMKLFSSRLRRGVDSRDPRVMAVVFEWFGTLNGDRVTGDLLYDTINRNSGRTTSDSSHLWHVHISFRRDRVTNVGMIDDLLDVLLGVPLPAPKPISFVDKDLDVVTYNEFLNHKGLDHPNPNVDDDEKASVAQLLRWIWIDSWNGKNDIKVVKAEVDTVEESVSAARNEVKAVRTEVDALKATLATVNAELKKTTTALAEVRTLTSKVDSVISTVDASNASVVALNSKLDSVLDAVSTEKEPVEDVSPSA